MQQYSDMVYAQSIGQIVQDRDRARDILFHAKGLGDLTALRGISRICILSDATTSLAQNIIVTMFGDWLKALLRQEKTEEGACDTRKIEAQEAIKTN